MTRERFFYELNKLGFDAFIFEHPSEEIEILVVPKGISYTDENFKEQVFASVSERMQNIFDIYPSIDNIINHNTIGKLIKIIVNYSGSLSEERESEQLYFLHVIPDSPFGYLALPEQPITPEKRYSLVLSDPNNSNGYQTKFTQEEIDNHPLLKEYPLEKFKEPVLQ